MRSPKFDTPQSRRNSAKLMLRLMLRHDELFRLPVTSRGVHVVSGQATYFQTVEELVQFIVQVLTSTPE